MPRLIVNPDTPEAWSIELQPGTISLGRGEANNVPTEHTSVSSSHCQVTVSDAGAWLKDLGSTAGTFVDGELIEQARLRSGQRIRLGEVELRYESDEPAKAESPEPPVPRRISAVPATNRFCKSHPAALARYLCPKCAQAVCELCITTRLADGATRRFCRRCGSECQPVEIQREEVKTPKGFLALLPGALLYPFQGSGVLMLVVGTLFFFVLGWMPLIGFIVTGYMFSYAKSIITSTTEGKTELPDWPDFTDWKDDILMPYLQLLALLALYFGPSFLIGIARPGTQTQTAIAHLAALGIGVLLAPMAILALAMFDHIGALNPIALAWSIARVPLPYAAAATAFVLVFLLHWLVEGVLESAISIPVLPGLISALVYLYLVAVGMRILGLLYLTHKTELGWFSR